MATRVSVHLFYGLFVTTSSLYTAAETYSKVQGPLLAIQLILHRKSTSTLVITQSEQNAIAAVTILPVEIWNMIKAELVRVELGDAQKELANRFVCDSCKERSSFHRLFSHAATVEELEIATRWEQFPINECDGCFDTVFDSDPWLNLDVEPLQVRSLSLLPSYSLESNGHFHRNS